MITTKLNIKQQLVITGIFLVAVALSPSAVQHEQPKVQQAGIFSSVTSSISSAASTVSSTITGSSSDGSTSDSSSSSSGGTSSILSSPSSTASDFSSSSSSEGVTFGGSSSSGSNVDSSGSEYEPSEGDSYISDGGWGSSEPVSRPSDSKNWDGACAPWERPYNPVTGEGTTDCGEKSDSQACAAADYSNLWLVGGMVEYVAEGVGDVQIAEKNGETYCVRGECVEDETDTIKNYQGLPVEACVYDSDENRNKLVYGAEYDLNIASSAMSWVGAGDVLQ